MVVYSSILFGLFNDLWDIIPGICYITLSYNVEETGKFNKGKTTN